MMKLLYKELKLSLHETTYVFMLLSTMLLIPNYPYYVIFFYTCLGIFFICLTGRENRDIYYMLNLPIKKSDIVKARFMTVIIIEVIQVIISIPFLILRNKLIEGPNSAGMDANVALIGFVFIMYSVFNIIFLNNYYKDTDKVGKSFLYGCTGVMTFIALAEASVHAIPFMKNYIDTKDPNFLGMKLIILIIGILVYVTTIRLTYKKSVANFMKSDF